MIRRTRHNFFFRNGLSLVLLSVMLLTWGGQAYMGWQENNNERQDEGEPPIEFGAYLQSDHFWTATAENWESEFLQMGMYVLLTISLRQIGSSESKKLDEKEEVDREPVASPKAPWAVRKGGLVLVLYKNSLSIAFAVLFLVAFVVHLNTSCGEFNAEQLSKGEDAVGTLEYLRGSRFWFESFQNWQSEFLAVLSIVFLSIYLRQKGSPESKAVDAPYLETGK
jgi:hypothetical protein